MRSDRIVGWATAPQPNLKPTGSRTSPSSQTPPGPNSSRGLKPWDHPTTTPRTSSGTFPHLACVDTCLYLFWLQWSTESHYVAGGAGERSHHALRDAPDHPAPAAGV